MEEAAVVFELTFIFLARTIDMCLGTLRSLMVMRGHRLAAAMIGFFEILVYTVALSMVMSAGSDPARLFVFCLGFSAGIALGITVEKRLPVGFRSLQATVDARFHGIVEELRELGHGVTVWEAEGRNGPKLVLQVITRRRQAARVAGFIEDRVPGAFVVQSEPKTFLGGLVRP